jgi:Phosphoesterase family
MSLRRARIPAAATPRRPPKWHGPHRLIWLFACCVAAGALGNLNPITTAGAGAQSAVPEGPTHPAATPLATPTQTPITATQGTAPAGSNLLVNGGAESGSPSQSGYDAVTIPGWTISAGLPTTPAYRGVPGSLVPSLFPGIFTPGPPSRGNAFFAGGAGGTSVLSQEIPLRPTVTPTQFDLSAWLGGSGPRSDAASVSLVFRNLNGRILSSTTISPLGPAQRHDRTALLAQHATGSLPSGAATAEVVLTMATTNTSYDTEQDSVLGYNYTFADNLSLTLTAPEPRPVLTVPRSTVPRFQHVFVVMMENESYSDVIGNVAQAPLINSLRSSGSVLTDMYAEVHPSDPNYLALSGGSTFGILGNPLESDPTLNIPGLNIADLVQQSGQTWKSYAQGADGPCDRTDHGYYYLDDLPFLYYRDIQENLARCRAHLVPQTQLGTDLRQASTTPNFAWIDANDYYDMEAGGIAAGDQWLRTVVTGLRQSPAWRDQSSLLIITWDEDHWDGQRPPQLIPTLLVGSRDVKAGYASSDRYTHYDLLRTIEAALGLQPSLTQNDRYAPPVNDVFSSKSP